MGQFTYISKDRFRLAPDTKVVTAGDYRRLIEANDLVSMAQTKAKAVVEDAKKRRKRSVARGFQEGVKLAKAEQAAKMLAVSHQAGLFFEDLEDQVIAAVMIALKKILGQLEPRQLAESVVRRLIQTAREYHRVSLRVPESMVGHIEEVVAQITAESSSVPQVTVVADPQLKPGECLMETPVGTVDGSVHLQLKAIQEAMCASLNRKPSGVSRQVAHLQKISTPAKRKRSTGRRVKA